MSLPYSPLERRRRIVAICLARLDAQEREYRRALLAWQFDSMLDRYLSSELQREQLRAYYLQLAQQFETTAGAADGWLFPDAAPSLAGFPPATTLEVLCR